MIIVGIVALLGLAAGAFLLFGKKNPTANQPVNNTATGLPIQTGSKTLPQANGATSTVPKVEAKPAAPKTSATTVEAAKAKALSQWQACKAKTMVASTNLFWSVQIFEGIPQGGTYAKGNLNGDKNYPVHVVIKSDSKIADQIKSRLIVGKAAFLRGNCSEVATDGSVVLSAF